jgi:hypothetical protein
LKTAKQHIVNPWISENDEEGSEKKFLRYKGKCKFF